MLNLVDAVSDINQFYPAYDNCYEVEIVQKDNEIRYPKLHAIGVTLGGESLTLARHPVTKKFCVSNGSPYTLQDTLTINWRESDSWTVKKFHEDWLAEIYDKKLDQFKSKINPYKTFRIYLPIPHATGGLDSGSNSNKNIIEVTNVIPQNTGSIGLKWTNSPSIVTHSISYYIESWEWVAADPPSNSQQPPGDIYPIHL